MHLISQRLLTLIIAVSIAGCAVSPRQFAEERTTLKDVDVCRAFESAQQSRDLDFIAQTSRELASRGIAYGDCPAKIAEENKTAGTVLIGLAAAALLIAVAASGGGGGGASAGSSFAGGNDYSWSWDQYYNQYGQLVWSCRGEQSGQFAELSRCQGRMQSDFKWPSKQAPRF